MTGQLLTLPHFLQEETPPTKVVVLATEQSCLSPQLLLRTLQTMDKSTVELTFSTLRGPTVEKSKVPNSQLAHYQQNKVSLKPLCRRKSDLCPQQLWKVTLGGDCPCGRLAILCHSLIINSGKILSFSRTLMQFDDCWFQYNFLPFLCLKMF